MIEDKDRTKEIHDAIAKGFTDLRHADLRPVADAAREAAASSPTRRRCKHVYQPGRLRAALPRHQLAPPTAPGTTSRRTQDEARGGASAAAGRRLRTAPAPTPRSRDSRRRHRALLSAAPLCAAAADSRVSPALTSPRGDPLNPAMPLAASEIRERFLRFFEERGHRRRAELARSCPRATRRCSSRTPAWCQFKDVFLGEETRDYTRATTVAEVHARLGQAQRSRERRPHAAPPHVLRDARQLLASATTSSATRSVRLGAASPKVCGIAAGAARASRSSARTTRPRELWREEIGAPAPTASTASARTTTSGRWATPARAARAPRSTSTSARSRGCRSRTATRPATAAAGSRSGTSSSCSSTATRAAR